jgi:nucleoside-diphosphate-sugar epimerase
MSIGRVLVTGATGFVGVEVARQLAAAGIVARLMIHRPHRAVHVQRLSTDLVAGDLRDAASLTRAVNGVNTVIHLAGRATFESYPIVRPTLVDGTALLARAAAAAGVEHFVFASSTMVHDGNGPPVNERTTPAPWSGYGRAKLEAEGAIARSAAAGPMRVGVLRLPHVYGAGDAMFAMARRGLLVAPGRGDNLFSHLHVEDAARALIRVAELRWSGCTPIADDAAASWREFIAVLRESFPRLRVLRVPARLAWLGAQAPAMMARLRDRPTLRTPEAVSGWNRSLVVESGTGWRALGISPRYPTIGTGVPAAARQGITGWVHPVDDHR